VSQAPHACLWCTSSFEPRRSGSPQRFCGTKCRTKFWSALRRWGDRAIDAGILSVADVKSGVATACTLPGHGAPAAPLLSVRAGDIASSIAVQIFVVEVERSKVDWLVRLRLLRPDQRNDFIAIIVALKSLGQPPSISRIT
jgi:hypothetical protein